MTQVTLSDLNHVKESRFASELADIFEESIWIAEETANKRPFSTVEKLHQSMVDVVEQASNDKKLRLIRAHPQLGSRERMGDLSTNEQRKVGLNQLDNKEYEDFIALNNLYMNTFQFPFIVAVKGKTKTDIYCDIKERLQASKTDEIKRALDEIYKIAYFRLYDRVKDENRIEGMK
nr:2-oxo-4-hydroxy-4-carboxy-5-ureidoimidazoline decarboxylase [Bacillus sp. Marseille-P3800]